MYENIKSKIEVNNESSIYFPCCNGVRQGENLSPFLFSVYINDLNSFLLSKTVNGIICDVNNDEISIYLKILLLLYADDTVLFSHTEADMQYSLDCFNNYCDTWKLTVNTTKTKIVILSSGRRKKFHFTLNNYELEIEKEYKYLGVVFTQSGAFNSAKKHIAEQGNKAMFALLRTIRTLKLPYEKQIELFDKTIKPILLYGSEIWGYGNCDIIERVQLKFLKHIFRLKKSTPTHMLFGELGIFPLNIEIKSRMLSFWAKLIENLNFDNFDTKLSSLLYAVIYNTHKQDKLKSDWINNVKCLLCNLGFSGIWDRQEFPNAKWLSGAVRQKLKDQYIQNWTSLLKISSSSVNFRLFKDEFKRSQYFGLIPDNLCRNFLAFRTRNHKLPVELGRWIGTPLNERKCTLCNEDIGDEFHFIMKCRSFNGPRKQLINPLYSIKPNVIKYKKLLNTTNIQQLTNLCIFIGKILRGL